MSDFAVRLSEAMTTGRINKSDLARRLNLSAAFISELCSGKKSPSDRTICDICDALDINETWLRTGEGPMMRETPRTVVDELARAYNLTPAVTRLLDAIAQAFVELDEDQADRILERLRMALSGAGDAALAHDEITRQMKEGPDESGPEIREESQAE